MEQPRRDQEAAEVAALLVAAEQKDAKLT